MQNSADPILIIVQPPCLRGLLNILLYGQLPGEKVLEAHRKSVNIHNRTPLRPGLRYYKLRNGLGHAQMS